MEIPQDDAMRLTDLEELRLAFQHLSRHAFEAFAPRPIAQAYGINPHEPPPLPTYRSQDLSPAMDRTSRIYLFHYLPIEAFRGRHRLQVQTPLFEQRLRSIAADDVASGR